MLDPGSLPTTTRADGAPSLAELRAIIEVSLRAHPELRRGLLAARADIDRRLGAAPARTGYEERRRKDP